MANCGGMNGEPEADDAAPDAAAAASSIANDTPASKRSKCCRLNEVASHEASVLLKMVSSVMTAPDPDSLETFVESQAAARVAGVGNKEAKKAATKKNTTHKQDVRLSSHENGTNTLKAPD